MTVLCFHQQPARPQPPAQHFAPDSQNSLDPSRARWCSGPRMPPTTTCPGCGSSNPSDFDDSTGRNVCTRCGTVLAENFLTSEITFGESSSGAKTVQGSRVAEGQTYVGGGRYHGGDGTSLEGREQSINEGASVPVAASAVACSRVGREKTHPPACQRAQLSREFCRPGRPLLHPRHHQQLHQGPQGRVCHRLLPLRRLPPVQVVAHAD